jgi:hypothetical protein
MSEARFDVTLWNVKAARGRVVCNEAGYQAMTHDENDALFKYIVRFHKGLVKPHEGAVISCLAVLDKWLDIAAGDKEMADEYYVRNREWIERGAELKGTLDLPEFKRSICARVISENKAWINRCNECKSVARTPLARQCFRCGNKW